MQRVYFSLVDSLPSMCETQSSIPNIICMNLLTMFLFYRMQTSMSTCVCVWDVGIGYVYLIHAGKYAGIFVLM